MKTVTISCAPITTPVLLHETLARELALPAWYGKNLDALHDCLTELEQTRLIFTDWSTLQTRLGAYGLQLALVLRSACEENPRLQVELEA